MPIPNKFISRFTIRDSFFEISGKIDRERAPFSQLVQSCGYQLFYFYPLSWAFAVRLRKRK